MLKMISWASYAQVVSGGLLLYYGWWFCRHGNWAWLRRPSPTNYQKPPPEPLPRPTEPADDPRLQTLVLLTSQITQGAHQAALAQQSPQALFLYLQQLLQRHPELKAAPFQGLISGVINEAYQRTGFIPLNATEQADLWEAVR